MLPLRAAILGFFCVLGHPALAGWEVTRSEGEPVQPGLEHRRIEVAHGEIKAILHLAVFDTGRFTFFVHDLGVSGTGNLAAAARDTGAVAGVNGGYFHPDNRPVGLVVSGGRVINGQERAPLLSGIVAANPERVFLLRPNEFKLGPRTLAALQGGPFLVDGGKTVPGLNATRQAKRTFVIAGTGSRWAIGICHAPTLAEMGAILALPGLIPGVDVRRALNLDGGSSTGFWCERQQDPLYLREITRVRNYLLLVPRADGSY